MGAAMQRFDIHEAVKRTGATLRQIDHLVSVGLVTPAEAAPRRGMSRTFTIGSLRYIAVAARLLSWGVEVSDIKSMIGNDKPMVPQQLRAKRGHETFIDQIWQKLRDPKRCQSVEVLLVFRIVDPDSHRILHYVHHFVPAESLVSAARTEVDGFFINLKGLAKQIDAAGEDEGA